MAADPGTREYAASKGTARTAENPAEGRRDPARAVPETISPWAGWRRKALALSTVAGRRVSLRSPDAYPERVAALARQASAARSLWQAIWTLWRIESLTFACADRWPGKFRLRDASLPLEAGPPAACGLAMAAVLEAGFDGPRLARALEQRADPRFVDFSFESLGLMLAAYEPDLFGRLTGALGRLGVMRRARLEPADPGEFLRSLPAQWRPYAAHGFGRLLYFKSHGLRGTVRGLRQRPYLAMTPALRGAVAAHGLVNGSSLAGILELLDAELPEELAPGLQGGAYNLLKLLAWSLPEQMAEVSARGTRSAEHLASARAEAERARRRQLGPGLEA